jgi:hypothetical protein
VGRAAGFSDAGYAFLFLRSKGAMLAKLVVERDRISGNAELVFSSNDCTGQAYLTTGNSTPLNRTAVIPASGMVYVPSEEANPFIYGSRMVATGQCNPTVGQPICNDCALAKPVADLSRFVPPFELR